MIAVLDASAAVRVIVEPGGAGELARLLTEAELVMAPELPVAQVLNTYWKYLHSGGLSRAASERGVRSSLELVDEFSPLEELAVEAFDLAALAGRPAYDMFYLVLPRRGGVADHRRRGVAGARERARDSGRRGGAIGWEALDRGAPQSRSVKPLPRPLP